jgi:uncharacterized membrane protein YgcG
VVIFRRAAQVLVTVLALLWLAPPPAHADDPLRLDEQLTDRSGVLGDRRPEAEAALRQLFDQSQLQLFVVFVHSFDGAGAQEWADRTARRSDLGDRDALLAVATRDRAYAYSFDDDFPLTDAQLADVAATAIEPPLAQNDWAGAVIGAANGYQAALNGQPVPRPQIRPGRPDTGGGIPVAVVAVPVVLLAALGLGGWLLWRHLRRAQAAPPPGGVSTEELAARADTLLVELDDELRTSERELTLATGQYGAEATRSFAAALDAARQEVAEAFRLRMSLDETAAGEPDRRRVLTEIIQRCEAADDRLDAEAEAFDQLRELETHVEQAVAELGRRRAAAQQRLPAAESALADLRGKYVGEALAAVSGNAAQARERLEFAGAALDRASDSIAAGQRSPAALAVRAAEEALSQADTLLDAIDRVGADLTTARATVDTLLVEVAADIAAARTAIAAQAPGGAAGRGATAEVGELTAAVAAAEQAAASVRAMLDAPTSDPLAAVRLLQNADAALDQALARVRDAADRAARARAKLDHALATARTEVASANEYITTRRGVVASQARTWLAEAQRRLATAEALAATDPVAALAEAQQATQWAGQARRAALADVDAWSPPGGGFAGGGDDALAGLAGAILGGILLGGGYRGPRYGRIGYGGGWGGWGGWGGNGFGGSGSRVRRGGGGGFGGGSRRGGGGRF